MRRMVLAMVVGLLGSCAAASGAAVTNAAVNTALAATASGISRSQGGCYAVCPDGTECVRATGLCEPLPCRGRCATNEKCTPLPVEHCVPAAEVDLRIEARPTPERVTPQ